MDLAATLPVHLLGESKMGWEDWFAYLHSTYEYANMSVWCSLPNGKIFEDLPSSVLLVKALDETPWQGPLVRIDWTVLVVTHCEKDAVMMVGGG